MEFGDIEPIFGEAKVDWAAQDSLPLHRFLFRVDAPDTSHLRIQVTDFRSNTWVAVRSVLQLEDLRDIVGIGGSWSEFFDYVIDSLKSEDVKLVMEGRSGKEGATHAKLVAKKSKGLPLLSFSLTKLVDSAASEATANISLGLFDAVKFMQSSVVKGKDGFSLMTKVNLTEKEKNETLHGQVDHNLKKQKLHSINGSNRADASASTTSTGVKLSPDKPAARDTSSTKVTNRVVPAYRRAKVRGVLLQDTEEENNH